MESKLKRKDEVLVVVVEATFWALSCADCPQTGSANTPSRRAWQRLLSSASVLPGFATGSVVQNFPSRGARQSRERETLSLADQFPAAPFVFSKLLWISKLPFGFQNLRSTCNISV